MQVVYANQPFPDAWTSSLFLAGPTPRDAETPSWRPEALQLLEQLGYDGVVFVPEPQVPSWDSGPDAYQAQMAWERQGLDYADVILFWIPRDMRKMPGLTTNVEFGRYVFLGKVVLGAPPATVGIRYLEKMLETDGEPGAQRHFTLLDALNDAMYRTQASILIPPRVGGERGVPLHVWTLPSVQNWYQRHRAVGNILEDAKLCWWAPADATYVLWARLWVECKHRQEEKTFCLKDL